MTALASVLTVNGTAYNQAARKPKGLLVDAWGWDLDSDYFLEFHEVVAGPQPQFDGPFSVSLTQGTTSPPVVFTGTIANVQPALGPDGRTWGYRALGLKYSANWIPVTATDGSGMIRFNVDPTNVAVYVAALTAQSVGQIISYCLTQHATALTAAGITTDSTTASQLAALTLVPNTEVDVSGERLWQAMESVFSQWARNIRPVILPSGLVRFVDITTGVAVNFEIGTDPVDPPMLSSNWTNCATRVVVRGQGLIEPGYVQTLVVNGIQSLTPAWTNTEQNDWTEQAFTNPTGATDNGSCSVSSPTTVACTSIHTSLTLATNYWDTVVGWIYLSYSLGTGLTFTESRQMTANTSTSTGVYTVTLNYALTNTNYDSYKIVGTNVPLSAGGLADVWRLYNVTDPGAYIGAHLVRQFPVPVPFILPNSTGAALVSYPISLLTYNTNDGLGVVAEGVSVPFLVDPVHGQVLFTRPVVEWGNGPATLATGGSGVIAPVNIYMLLAYSRGALETVYPPDILGVPQYSGTAYTIGGLERTQYVDVPSWTYYGNVSVLNSLAQMLHASVCNTVVEGNVTFRGLSTIAQSPAPPSVTPGYLLSFSGNGYTTGWESLNISIRGQTVRYVTDGNGGLQHATSFRVSTRQDPRTGESFYDHLSVLGTGAFVPRSGENIGPAGTAQLNTSNPFNFGDGELADTSGFAEGLNINEAGTGKYQNQDIKSSRKRKSKPQQEQDSLGLGFDPTKFAGLGSAQAAAGQVGSGPLGKSLDQSFPAGIEGSTGSIASGSNDPTPLTDPPAATTPDTRVMAPKTQPYTPAPLAGAPTSAPPSAPSVKPMGQLGDDFMGGGGGIGPAPDFDARLPE